ncbi:3-phosphoshikimate 1-carboxyvinyltransferase [Renibacterium salmoninarum ATCC 33209]|uniref:3-phosphoshikimate 1-carboxyvinyltransferase n=2 Tax=Renibacterium salmoninarum TaxID=1646 RepID=A9WPK5_RENSM|nr:3-phosphoshikimate 1-carboxyvinyltransferase [Renibacterium salmoninarum ATCC 33209]
MNQTGTMLESDNLWPAPVAEKPISADLTVPGSKSLTNRYLVLAALADGPSRLRAPLHSRDSLLMVQALRQLGAEIKETPGQGAYGPDLLVTPIKVGQKIGQTAIDCGLAGTVMRFVPPLAALVEGLIQFDGDEHARLRPMGPVLTSLSSLGVAVRPVKSVQSVQSVQEDHAAEDASQNTALPQSLPFVLDAAGSVEGGYISLDSSGSSQFVSALLLAAPQFKNGLHLEHLGKPVPSLDHIAMTVRLLREAGVEVDDSVPNHWIVAAGPIRAFDVIVEQDLSNAGPFLAAALVSRGTVRITGWPVHTSQVGDSWREILTAFGADVVLEGDTLIVTGGAHISGVELADTSELAPTVAALCALAEGPSRLTGIAHLRGHETDRLAALAAEINALGGHVAETADGLIIEPQPLHSGIFHSYADHRMATAGAIIGLAVPGVAVENIATTAKTMPEFPELWHRMLAQ